jgi:hypothetical protein
VGRGITEGLASAVKDGITTLEGAVAAHLSGNFYCPHPEMWSACLAAISKVNAGDPTAKVALPEGVTYKDQEVAPARALVEAFQLEPFLEVEE